MENQEKTCVICLQNYEECENFKLIPLATNDANEESYLNKIHYMTLYNDLEEEHWEICPDCSEDLIKTCDFKKKLTNAVEFWKNYQTTMHKSESIVYETQTCSDTETDNVFSSETLVQEIKSESDKTEYNTFVCELCLQVFLNNSDAANHTCSQSTEAKSSDIVTNSRYFTSKECVKDSLPKYCVKVKTEGNRCPFCNKDFRHQSSLREHMNSHTKEQEFACNVCGKVFHRRSCWYRHKLTHLAPPGEKAKKSPFLCSICGKNFPYSNSFQRHMRMHLAEKRHKCNICGKAFSQASHLKVHLRTHSGEKPYVCVKCNGSFALNSTLQKHMKRHNKSQAKGS